MNLTKAHIVKEIAKDVGCTQKKASEILSVLLSSIKSALAKEGCLSLRKFGRFYLTTQKPRKIKHPRTGKHIHIRKREVARFKCSKVIEEELNVFRWTCDDPHNQKILDAIYDLIEDSEIEDEDEDEMMYYPGKPFRS
jgi:nucleoid DNA-binding protein